MNSVIIPERTEKSINGLKEMIDYINSFGIALNMSIMEFGSWVGTSAIVFAKNFREVYCIDPFESVKDTITEKYDMTVIERTFKSNILPHANIKHMRLASTDLFKEENQIIFDLYDCEKVDIVYIDGNHNYPHPKRDIKIAKRLATKFIAGHDYERRFPGVVKSVNEVFGKPDKVFSDTSWIVRI